MRLTGVALEDFRSYGARSEARGLRRIITVVGPNNSGKSNLLEALRLTRALLLSESIRPLEEYVRQGSARNTFQIELTFSLENEEREKILGTLAKRKAVLHWLQTSSFAQTITYSYEIDARRRLVAERAWTFYNGEIQHILEGALNEGSYVSETVEFGTDIPENRPEKLPFSRVQFLNARPDGVLPLQNNQQKRTIAHAFSEILRDYARRWYWMPPVRQAQARIAPGQDQEVVPSGANVAKVLNYVQTEDPEKFLELANEIRRVVPTVNRLTAPLRGSEVTAVVREPGVQVDLTNTSAGLNQVIILTAALRQWPEGSLVMIEEPELHLHAAAQRALRRYFKEEVNRRNHVLLMTTHSTVLAQISPEASVLAVNKIEGKSVVKMVEDRPGLQEITRALGHEPTDLYGYRAVLLVEGDTEEFSLPLFAEADGFNFSLQGIRLFNIRGSGRTKQMRATLEFLANTSTDCYVMLDGGTEPARELAEWSKAGLLKANHGIQWPLEFEDTFSTAALEIACTAYLDAEKKPVRPFPTDEVERARQKGKSVVPVISRFIFERTGKGLEKPVFGELLARAAIGLGENPAPRQALKDILRRYPAP